MKLIYNTDPDSRAYVAPKHSHRGDFGTLPRAAPVFAIDDDEPVPEGWALVDFR